MVAPTSVAGGASFTNDAIYFSSFAEGEFGAQGSWLVGWGLTRTRLYYRGAWHGTNIMRFYDGSVGPRAGTADCTPAGMPTGVVGGMGYTAVPDHDLWFNVGTACYNFSAQSCVKGQTLTTYTGALAAAPVAPIASVQLPAQTLLTSLGDGCYVLDHNALTLTACTDKGTAAKPPGGSCIEWYMGLAWIGAGSGAVPSGQPASRLYYSHALDGTTWNTTQDYVDIGAPSGWGIVGLFNQRTHLLIAKQDGTWWTITGVPVPSDASGVGSPGTTGNMVIRQVTQANGFQLGVTRACSVGGMCYFVPRYYDFPAMHNGSKQTNLRYLSFNGGNWDESSGAAIFPPSFNVIQLGDTLRGPTDVMFLGQSGNAALCRDSVWTLHNFAQRPAGGGGAAAVGEKVALCDGGTATSAAKFYTWTPTLDVPADGTQTQPIMDGTVNGAGGQIANTVLFQLPEWQHRSGWMVVVRSVQVHFRKFNVQHTGQTNHFDMEVVSTRLYGTPANPNVNNGQRASNTYAWDEATSAAPADGEIETMYFMMGEQGRGGGFYLNFTNLRGVAIQVIEVILEQT